MSIIFYFIFFHNIYYAEVPYQRLHAMYQRLKVTFYNKKLTYNLCAKTSLFINELNKIKGYKNRLLFIINIFF